MTKSVEIKALISDAIKESISYLEYREDELRAELIDPNSPTYLEPLIAAKVRGTRQLINKLSFVAGLL